MKLGILSFLAFYGHQPSYIKICMAWLHGAREHRGQQDELGESVGGKWCAWPGAGHTWPAMSPLVIKGKGKHSEMAHCTADTGHSGDLWSLPRSEQVHRQ